MEERSNRAILWAIMSQVALDTPLYEVLGAKSVFLKRLEKLGLKTVRDLLWHFPARYEDFSKIYPVSDLEPGQQATVTGIIEEVTMGQSWRKHMSIVHATIADETGSVRAIWFNQPYVVNVLKAGRRANFSGKVSLSEEGEMYLTHPAYEILRSTDAVDAETRHTGRLVPVYPETRGLTSRGLRFIMQNVLKRALPLKEWIPEPTLAALGFPEVTSALGAVHFPKRLTEAAVAENDFPSRNYSCSRSSISGRSLSLRAKRRRSSPMERPYVSGGRLGRGCDLVGHFRSHALQMETGGNSAVEDFQGERGQHNPHHGSQSGSR